MLSLRSSFSKAPWPIPNTLPMLWSSHNLVTVEANEYCTVEAKRVFSAVAIGTSPWFDWLFTFAWQCRSLVLDNQWFYPSTLGVPFFLRTVCRHVCTVRAPLLLSRFEFHCNLPNSHGSTFKTMLLLPRVFQDSQACLSFLRCAVCSLLGSRGLGLSDSFDVYLTTL